MIKDKSARLLEWVLNLFSIAFIAFFLVRILTRHFEPQGQRQFGGILKLGQTVPIKDLDWDKSPPTLVLALSTGCQFCTDSAPFYRALFKAQVAHEWQAVAVLPQSVEMARTYLQSEGYSIPQILQIDLGTIGVSATPTLLLVDERGRLQQQWIGRLSSSEEDDVAAHLRIDNWGEVRQTLQKASSTTNAFGTYSPLITTAELLAMLHNEDVPQLLDVRERSQYAQRRITSALNIPVDELAVRAPHELLPDAPTILYCDFSAACQARGIPSLCSNATEQLRKIGLTNVRVVRDPLPLLEAAGVSLTRPQNEP